jgi:light-regulated signal transduction histidine kinase (bacteriophytochrome)
MSSALTDEQLQEALDECAAEPVHIPGRVQPYGALVAFDPKSEEILYASENCEAVIGRSVTSLLSKEFGQAFGRETIHAIRNAAGQPNFVKSSAPLGAFEINRRPLELHAFGSQDLYVVEFEAEGDIEFGTEQALDAISLMIETIKDCDTQKELFDLTVGVLRHLTGYDRVMIYKFDQDYNGEVISETKRARMEPFIGLRFPSYDIPQRARDIMAKLSLRFIEDVDQDPVPLLAARKDLPPLDISFAATRGVSPVHMEYLRNMGSKSTMTLSVVVRGDLWGIISFHHGRPNVPTAKLRNVLSKFLPIFTSKLETLMQRELLHLLKNVDQIKDRLLIEIDEDTEMESFFPSVAPTIAKVLKADGVSAVIGSQNRSFGQVPGQSVMNELLKLAHEDRTQVVAIDNLSARFPHLSDDLNGMAGALVYAINPGRAICFFREEIERKIAWAGNPEKTVEVVSGRMRLMPRGSFMTYLEQVGGTSEPWTDQDLFFTHRIWAIINSAERRALLNTLNRQQALMIDELNHRVRNILALVRSVSKQARRHYSSLQSYSKSVEARIQALAAVHEIASGASKSAVDLQRLIRTEFAPYDGVARVQVGITGENPMMRADIAPIFSLVIHELTTNAAKYGALSISGGSVSVSIERVHNGYDVVWQETGGPQVSEPKGLGFGSTLIRDAVPHEMNGKATLTFAETGVVAELFLPDDLFDLSRTDTLREGVAEAEELPLSVTEKAGIPGKTLCGTALVLEDNFVIAKEMGDQMDELGFEDVVKVSSVEKALDFIDSETPTVAVLDVNLGGGQTSEPVALRLAELNVAFVFVTGYGEKAKLPPELSQIPRLTKPVDETKLKNALAVQLSRRSNVQ